MSAVIINKVPEYFKSLFSMTDEGRPRWFDDYAENNNIIIEPHMLTPKFRQERYMRNMTYSNWLASKFNIVDGKIVPILSGKQMRWQVIQVLTTKHAEKISKPWWEPFQDCLFRVFVQPETVYDNVTGQHQQWYVLSPEDCYLVNRWRLQQKGINFPPRDYEKTEKFLTSIPQLRNTLLVPVDCCRHWRHETTAGVLPDGL